MERKFVIGPNLDQALLKYPVDSTIYEIENPFKLDSSKLELKLIFGIIAHQSKDTRELSATESKHLKWVRRMYPELLSYRYFGVAIKFTEGEKEELINFMKEYYKKDSFNLSNIYRIFTFCM